mgnify:CR=1 FL=1
MKNLKSTLESLCEFRDFVIVIEDMIYTPIDLMEFIRLTFNDPEKFLNKPCEYHEDDNEIVVYMDSDLQVAEKYQVAKGTWDTNGWKFIKKVKNEVD